MMSFRGWVALLIFYIAYLILGGFVFQALESPYDCEELKNRSETNRQIQDSIQDLKGKTFLKD